MGGGKKGGQTIGYTYIMTMLSGLCHTSINGLLAIIADDKIAWSGNVTNATPTPVNSPDLFGGEQKEGGIQGGFILLRGEATQIVPGPVSLSVGSTGPVQSVTIPNIRTSIGGRVSQLRQFSSVVWRGMVAAMNPYPKEWHFRYWRTTAGWHNDDCWYPTKATICMASGAIRAMNPAHIIYQCLTDPSWGAAQPIAMIDENSFVLAANRLCAEGFGLCFNWSRQEDVDTFIQTVINHIGAVLYNDRFTGKFVLRLIRADYVEADLPFYDFNSGLLKVAEDDSASSDDSINEIQVKGLDAITFKDLLVRVQNTAAREGDGINSQTVEMPGIPTKELALRVAARELRVHASGLKKLKLEFDRRAFGLVPGAVVRIAAPSRGITSMVLRLGEVDYGSTHDSTIKVRAVEDVFGMPGSTFASGGDDQWTPPSYDALPSTTRDLIEAGYRDIVLQIGTATTTVAATDCYIGQLALSPGYAYQYDLATEATGETSFIVRARGSFTGGAVLAADIAPLDTTITFSSLRDFDSSFVGQALLIGNEVVRLDVIDVILLTATIARGCADTIPQVHSAGVQIWTLDDDLVSDIRVYASGETVQSKVLTRTSSQVLDMGSAPTDSVTFIGRQDRPYPPGKVQVDALSVYSLTTTLHATPVLTWTHRDRLTEDDQLVEHGASSVGPEAGTTYTIRVKTADGVTLLRTVTGLSGITWTYDGTMQTADGNPPIVLMEMESVRGGITSWQMYSFLVGITALPGSGGGDPDWSDVVFLSGFEGGAVIDESLLAQAVTAHGGAAVSATQAKFGTQSLSRAASGDYISVPDNAAFFSGTTHFTIEGWFYWVAKPASEHGLMGQGDRTSDRGWAFYYDHPGTFLDLEIYDGASFQDAISVLWEPALNTWYHIAADFDGTAYRVYVDGVTLQASVASYSMRNTTERLTVGGYLNGGSVSGTFDGFIDEVRVTAGVARYATDVGFTPPTAAFPRG